MKASLHARFVTIVSLTVAYEARTARILYGTNRGFSCAGNKENLTCPNSARGRFWAPSDLLFAGETNRSVDRFVSQYTPGNRFRSRSTEIESAANISSPKGMHTATWDHRCWQASIRRQRSTGAMEPRTQRQASRGSASRHCNPCRWVELSKGSESSPKDHVCVSHVLQVDFWSAYISANKGALKHRMMCECHSPGW